GPEALDRFPIRNVSGSILRGGSMDDRPFLGAATPAPEFEGEGGPPVGGEGGDGAEGGGPGDVSPPACPSATRRRRAPRAARPRAGRNAAAPAPSEHPVGS